MKHFIIAPLSTPHQQAAYHDAVILLIDIYQAVNQSNTFVAPFEKIKTTLSSTLARETHKYS